MRTNCVNNQAKLVGWYSDLDEQQLGALFVSRKMIETRRDVVEKFMRAYRRGAADYTTALLRKDRSNKRVSDTKSREAATVIARYVYPDRADVAPPRSSLQPISSTRRRGSMSRTSSARSPGSRRGA